MVESKLKVEIFNKLIKKEKPITVLVGTLFVQVIFALIISNKNIPDNVLTHLMYLPIFIAAFMFDYRIGILSGIIAELLIDVFNPSPIGLAETRQIQASVLRLFYFCGAGLVIGLIKNLVYREPVEISRSEDLPSRLLFSSWENFDAQIQKTLDINKVIKFRLVLIEISNQNDLLASFGLENVKN